MRKTIHASMMALGLLFSTVSIGAEVSVIHGINGSDLGLTEALPVDISVNGACLATNVQFQDSLGPLALDAGQYTVEVKLANSAEGDCQGALAITKNIHIQFGESSTLIAHVSETGSPTLNKFLNDPRNPDHDSAKLSIRHTAAAPEVAVYVAKNRRVKAVWPLINGQKKSATLPSGHYQVYVVDQQRGFAKGILAGPISVDLSSQSLNRIYAIGSIENSTFDVLPEATQ